jgi:hypothetical protein
MPSTFSRFFPAVPARGNVFQVDDVQRVKVHRITSLIRDYDCSGRQEDEVRMRHGELVTAGCDRRKWAKRALEAASNMFNIHAVSVRSAWRSVKKGERLRLESEAFKRVDTSDWLPARDEYFVRNHRAPGIYEQRPAQVGVRLAWWEKPRVSPRPPES